MTPETVFSITGLGKSAGGSRMRRSINRKGMLVSIGLLVTVSVAACTAGKAPGSAEPDNGHTATATVAASPAAATPSVTPGAASASSAPPASAWLAASEIPFGATYGWSLDTGNANSAPIGAAEGNGVYYVSPDTVFQAITSCGSPSLLLSTPLGARQRLFEPTSGALRELAGQWISSYPDATAAQAAWHRLQAAYAACPAQAGNLPITLTETAQTPDAMAWFHSTNGKRFGDIAPYAHEYFVLHETQIAYLYVEGAGPALATTPNDAQVLAAITRHLNA
ncbi:MAG: hypothetical protein WAK44_16285 [Trebonia sp.]|uniref:hypothetical protein n=1 Tax=Trebonia sp. TaxID=2767075 RepID=UPI003BAE61EE